MPERKRILVVDDSEDNRLFIAEILEDNGYDFYIAQNGEQALEAVREHDVDLILLDIMMPRKSGIFVFREIKEDPALRGIPIIVISGASAATGVDITTGEAQPVGSFSDQYPRALGATIHRKLSRISPDALLEKPLDPPKLVAKIKEILDGPPQPWVGADI